MAEAKRETPAQRLLSDKALAAKRLDVTKLAWRMVNLQKRGSEAEQAKRMRGKRRLIQKWRNGEVEPSLANAVDLARVLGGKPEDYRSKKPRASSWRAEIERRVDEMELVVSELRSLIQRRPSARKGKG